MSNQLASEKVVVSAPFSFAGSAQRIWKITKADNLILKLILVPLAITLIIAAWMFVACWYFVMYVLFGILFIPYRLLRRSSRKNKRDKLRHREVLDAIEQRKQLWIQATKQVWCDFDFSVRKIEVVDKPIAIFAYRTSFWLYVYFHGDCRTTRQIRGITWVAQPLF